MDRSNQHGHWQMDFYHPSSGQRSPPRNQRRDYSNQRGSRYVSSDSNRSQTRRSDFQAPQSRNRSTNQRRDQHPRQDQFFYPDNMYADQMYPPPAGFMYPPPFPMIPTPELLSSMFGPPKTQRKQRGTSLESVLNHRASPKRPLRRSRSKSPRRPPVRKPQSPPRRRPEPPPQRPSRPVERSPSRPKKIKKKRSPSTSSSSSSSSSSSPEPKHKKKKKSRKSPESDRKSPTPTKKQSKSRSPTPKKEKQQQSSSGSDTEEENPDPSKPLATGLTKDIVKQTKDIEKSLEDQQPTKDQKPAQEKDSSDDENSTSNETSSEEDNDPKETQETPCRTPKDKRHEAQEETSNEDTAKSTAKKDDTTPIFTVPSNRRRQLHNHCTILHTAPRYHILPYVMYDSKKGRVRLKKVLADRDLKLKVHNPQLTKLIKAIAKPELHIDEAGETTSKTLSVQFRAYIKAIELRILTYVSEEPSAESYDISSRVFIRRALFPLAQTAITIIKELEEIKEGPDVPSIQYGPHQQEAPVNIEEPISNLIIDESTSGPSKDEAQTEQCQPSTLQQDGTLRMSDIEKRLVEHADALVDYFLNQHAYRKGACFICDVNIDTDKQ